MGFVYDFFKMLSLGESVFKGMRVLWFFFFFYRFLDCRKSSIYFIFYLYIFIGYRIWEWGVGYFYF